MKSLLAWLHLSDLHLGHPSAEHGFDLEIVRNALLEDLQPGRVPDRPAPRYVLSTGDIGFAGEADNYRIADEFLRSVGEVTDIPTEKFYLVPGNHDADRGRANSDIPLYAVIEKIGRGELTLDAALNDDETRPLLEKRFQAYREFTRAYARAPRDRWLSWTDTIEGDEGLRVRLAGLNSALLVHEDPAKERLAIPKRVREPINQAHAANLNVVLTHHPIDSRWLTDHVAVRELIGESAQIALSGHVHYTTLGLERQCAWFGAGALHEDERSPGESYEHGYAVCEILVDDERRLHFRVWPRRWAAGGFGLDPKFKDGDPKPLGVILPAPEPPEVEAPAPRAAEPIQVAVVAVRDEFPDELDAVARRLGASPHVAGVRTVDAAGGTLTASIDFYLVLLGGRSGGTSVLAESLALDEARCLLSPNRTPREFRAERDALDPLRDAQEDAGAPEFEGATEAADLAWALLHDVLRDRTGTTVRGVLEDFERRYLDARSPRWESGDNVLLQEAIGGRRLERALLYVPVKAVRSAFALDENGVVRRAGSENGGPLDGEASMVRQREENDWTAATVERVLCEPDLRHVVVRGEPGSGKTVLLEHIAHSLACYHRGLDWPVDCHLDLDRLRGDHELVPVPLLVRAPDLVTAGCGAGDLEALYQYLTQEVRKSAAEVEVRELQAALEEGRYLLLVDSLDEVPTEQGRKDLMETLRGLARTANSVRVVVSTRPTIYLGDVDFGDPFEIVEIAPFDAEQAKHMVERWADFHALDPEDRSTLEEAIGELEEKYERAALQENPLLLTCVLYVWQSGRELPRNTAELYDRVVEILCRKRKGSLEASHKRELLGRLFHAMQEADSTELAVDDDRVRDLRDHLDELHRETGLLRFDARRREGRQERLVKPWHRSFQEFLCADHLERGRKPVRELVDDLGDRLHRPSWTLTLRFLAGRLGQRVQEDARQYLSALEGAVDASPAEKRGRVLTLLAGAVREYERFCDGEVRARIPTTIVREFEQHGASWPLRDRVECLDELGRLGDPRLQEPMWVTVPSGEYTLGGDLEGREEIESWAGKNAPRYFPDEHVEDLPSVLIAWHPVTVAEYECFGKDHPPEDWVRQLRHPNHPVVNVSAKDADAFVAWAREAGAVPVPEGYVLGLPTEDEWEAAARGRGADVFPWGPEPPDDERANFGRNVQESTRLTTSPIGAFPRATRIHGSDERSIVDLAGNAWEWTSSEWDPGGGSRVLRGGSWANPDPRNLRCANRNRNDAENRNPNVGFRLVCRVPREHGS